MILKPEDVQKIYDEWPEEEELLPFDDFLTGGAMNPARFQDYGMFNRQISGVSTPKDLTDPQALEFEEIQTRNDLGQFATTRVELLDEKQYEDLFYAAKRAAFGIFNFVTVKSLMKGDTPMSERDLVLEDEDHYLLEYLRGQTKDYYRVQQIATLMAYREMGIDLVRFQRQDGCPVCRAHDGLFYNVAYLLDLLGSGSDLTHPSCDISWFPVIFRESYRGPLKDFLNIPVLEHCGKVLRNVPLEMAEEIRGAVESSEHGTIEFVNMVEYLLNDLEASEDSSGAVVYCSGDVMRVHNSYVGMRGPARFITAYAQARLVPEKIEVGSSEESFFVRGRAAVKRNGSFWDASTGELIC